MPIVFCPRCNTRHLVSRFTDDFICTCDSGDTALDNDSILEIGDWDDFTGSGTVQAMSLRAQENTLQGTRAQIEGREIDFTRNAFGENQSTHRLRQHEEFFEIRK